MLRQIKLTGNRKMSLFNVFKSWNNTCEKVECTKPTEPAQKYIIEKNCCPSIFESWKPKVPDLKSNPIKVQMMRKYDPPKDCVPGMKVPPISRCELDAKAKLCQQRNHPSWIKHCPKRPKNQVDGPLPPLKAAFVECRQNKGKGGKSQTKSMRRKCPMEIPASDWNIDGFLG